MSDGNLEQLALEERNYVFALVMKPTLLKILVKGLLKTVYEHELPCFN